MNILLDTYTFLWVIAGSDKLSEVARKWRNAPCMRSCAQDGPRKEPERAASSGRLYEVPEAGLCEFFICDVGNDPVGKDAEIVVHEYPPSPMARSPL